LNKDDYQDLVCSGVDFDHLQFPAIMTVDWVRYYQDENNINIGCDPEDFPTAAYIEQWVNLLQYGDLVV